MTIAVKENLIILYSGGADSRLLLELAKECNKVPFCVLIDYGQKHIDELKTAEIQLLENGIEHTILQICNLDVDSGLTGDMVGGKYEGVHEMHVPSRNLIFIGIAASIAENFGIDTIWYGPDYSDYLNQFPDCKQEWVGRVNKILEINGPFPIKLEAPLMGLTKENILEILKNKYSITKDQLYSGYGDK